MRARASVWAVLSCALILAGCGEGPPQELNGLWSAGPAACAAGMGVRFEPDAITAIYRNQRETLFEQPRYEVEERGAAFRVRIVYDLPRLAGGAQSAGAHGVLVLARDSDGVLAPTSHTLVDTITGSVRMRIADDPARALTLRPCGDHPWTEPLRGREA